LPLKILISGVIEIQNREKVDEQRKKDRKDIIFGLDRVS
jgi:hypothetical protein